MAAVKHMLFHSLAAWGHNKPMAALAVFITRARPDIVITIITTGSIHAKLVNELKSKLSTEKYNSLSPRINVIDIVGQDTNPFEPLKEFAPAYEALRDSQPLTCKSSGRTLSGLPSPSVALLDPFAAYAYEFILSVPNKKVHIIAWISAPSGPLVGLFGPPSLGGKADPFLETEAGRKKARTRISLMFNEQGGDFDEHGDSLSTRKEIISGYEKSKIPGIPPMYTHEWTPQISLMPQARKLHLIGQVYTRESDGVIIASNSTGRPAFAMAPLSLPKPNHQLEGDENILKFLETTKEKYGSRSLIYISFGTFFWPPQEEKLAALIETLIANRKPFLFAHASPLAQLSDELLTMIKQSGIGMETAWSPQETILQHEATGWFITHGYLCGFRPSSSLALSLAALNNVRRIFWPMGADQPLNAAVLGLTHEAAFELVEVRSGEDGTKPLLRFENTEYKPTFTVDAVRAEVERLLVKINGDAGQVVRSNFERLGKEMWKSWDEGGQNRRELNAFLKQFVDCR
ncbi:glycosyltransferase family 1 protein [Collybiopsis luxurians FD-317 M1]|uniref:Glycosyltransferase family 1 protein n=1 Tax=Collybiopsis luxurians FD-317 M1 TaxID=944289 RepID=A0A0D0CIR5_9AGAR|nr:glycosyltransferase family 1 protein [Collybiopsis luxurians FD-317 M1]